MEFKGTKGKWYLQEYTDAYTNIIRCDNGKNNTIYLASTSQCQNSEERYNAQVMAHSKEMLEMLQMWCMDMEERGRAYGDCYTMTKELIKSATEVDSGIK